MRLVLLLTVLATTLAACAAPPGGLPGAESVPTGTARTTIAAIQGRGPRSPLEGRPVEIDAVVVQVAGGLGGVFVGSLAPDDDPRTAEGLFVPRPRDAEPRLRQGDRVRLAGVVRELGDDDAGDATLTALEPTAITPVGHADVPETRLVAPPPHGWESLEGMRVVVEAPLTVTGVDALARHGELALAFDGRLFAPTELAPPGPQAEAIAADNARRLLRVDDARTRPDPDDLWFLPAHDDTAPLRVGSTIARVVGVVDQRFGRHRLQLVEALGGIGQAPRPAPPTVAGDRRIAGFNLLNLFNGDGAGGGFPTERGAEDFARYERQQAKLVAIVQGLQPDLAALMELENDGFGPRSSIAQFVDALNAAGPHRDWRFVDAGDGPGVDGIRVGMIYRASRFTPVGAPATRIDGPFAERSRAPLAQAFRACDGRACGPVFVVAANHFKSKGCGRDVADADADRGDGQACFNAVRVESARRLHEWLAGDPTGTAPAGTLVIGDLNAHAQEDPLRWLAAHGWRDAFAIAGEPRPYSYVFAAQSARLDHALVDAGLAARVRGAAHWHANADESEAFDYRRDGDGDPWRASDHDPMLVGFDLTRPAL